VHADELVHEAQVLWQSMQIFPDANVLAGQVMKQLDLYRYIPFLHVTHLLLESAQVSHCGAHAMQVKPGEGIEPDGQNM
jgi:hypothetical protein